MKFAVNILYELSLFFENIGNKFQLCTNSISMKMLQMAWWVFIKRRNMYIRISDWAKKKTGEVL